jgi:hypothetical protein
VSETATFRTANGSPRWSMTRSAAARPNTWPALHSAPRASPKRTVNAQSKPVSQTGGRNNLIPEPRRLRTATSAPSNLHSPQQPSYPTFRAFLHWRPPASTNTGVEAVSCVACGICYSWRVVGNLIPNLGRPLGDSASVCRQCIRGRQAQRARSRCRADRKEIHEADARIFSPEAVTPTTSIDEESQQPLPGDPRRNRLAASFVAAVATRSRQCRAARCSRGSPTNQSDGGGVDQQ